MTYGYAKSLLLKIIDESKPKADILDKLPMFFDIAQKKIALHYPIYKSAVYKNADEKALPPNFGRAFRVLDENENAIPFVIKNGTIQCAATAFELVYEATPLNLPASIPEDYELETQNEAILALVFYIAAMLNQTEHDQRYFTNFYAQYQGEMQNLNAVTRQAVAVPMAGGANECLCQ